MNILSLDGTWNAREAKRGGMTVDANVPGCIHHDLEQAGLIPDPYVGENEIGVQWIGERDWIYERSFTVADDLLCQDRLLLQCDGLDTLATIIVNGKVVGRADNMFRQWEFDVASVIKPGENTISIRFASARMYGLQQEKTLRPLQTVKSAPWELPGRCHMRKEQCNFGWDWGPVLVTAGIWQSIRLVACSRARIDEVKVEQVHRGSKVSLDIGVLAESLRRSAVSQAEILIGYGSTLVATDTVALVKGKACSRLAIPKPKLWWPAGHGAQPLYTVTVILRNADGGELDRWEKRIGLRTLELVQKKDKWGQSFTFACNGRSFFSKGANWIPADAIKARVTEERIRDLLQSAVDCNMNMLRVWGGGLYEPDYFYDLCDELGICVWQDFMFACGAYPSDQPEWLANFEAEATYQIKRLRHHASMALWCGNNELEMGSARSGRPAEEQTWKVYPWEFYAKVFDKLLPKLIKKHDGIIPYWPCSPHTPIGNRDHHADETCGDTHSWAVWHGKQPFEWYRGNFSRFCSEFGFQSFPEPKTVATYAKSGDESNVTSAVMEHHQRSGIGNSTIMQYMLNWFPLPKGSEEVFWLSQIQQGLAIKYAVEHWRQHMDRCRGALYWQLNDCWPVASWASIDYYHRWKALHYMSKRFFNPLLVSGVEIQDKQKVDVHVSSDLPTATRCSLKWRITSTAGEELASGTKSLQAKADKSAKVLSIDCKQAIAAVGKRRILIWLELWRGKTLVSHNLVNFEKPKHMGLETVSYKRTVKKTGPKQFAITITCDKPSLWTWFSLKNIDARWSDSFACLAPKQDYQFTAITDEDLSLKAFKEQFEIMSIRDTF